MNALRRLTSCERGVVYVEYITVFALASFPTLLAFIWIGPGLSAAWGAAKAALIGVAP